MIDRREFLSVAALALLPLGLRARQQPQGAARSLPIPSDTSATGFLPKPELAGVSRPAVTAMDSDPVVVGIEHRVRCPCPCGLDVYTCRTTDFTCSYSPERHAEVLALVQRGMSADQVVAALVAKYGESTLMAPKPNGFNLFGYLVPGSIILLLGAAITTVIASKRRQRLAPAAEGRRSPAATAAGGTPEEMAKLERAMKELDG
ncbi:MAG: cytochrome c-type biogenesis protein CcmH [Gemmatimonadales bacterium]